MLYNQTYDLGLLISQLWNLHEISLNMWQIIVVSTPTSIGESELLGYPSLRETVPNPYPSVNTPISCTADEICKQRPEQIVVWSCIFL